MELIVTDTEYADIGMLDFTDGDFAFGTDENDFSLNLSADAELPQKGAVIYSEDDGSVGGIVREHDSDDGKASVGGSSWTGILAEKTLKPPAGEAYWVANGDIRTIAAQLVTRLGLDDLVYVTSDMTGIVVRHTFAGSREETQQDAGRYMNGWAALWQLCYEHACKPVFRWDPSARKIALTCRRLVDHTDDESMQAKPASVKIKNALPINHLVCLGSGELEERDVVDLYADARGNISTRQTLFGIDEISEIFDDPSASDMEELVRQGTARFKERRESATSVDIAAPDGVFWNIGDIVGGIDERTGISARATVTKKVVRLDGKTASVEHSTTIRSKK